LIKIQRGAAMGAGFGVGARTFHLVLHVRQGDDELAAGRVRVAEAAHRDDAALNRQLAELGLQLHLGEPVLAPARRPALAETVSDGLAVVVPGGARAARHEPVGPVPVAERARLGNLVAVATVGPLFVAELGRAR
jgi:hypothetical protein